ncbi:AlpA family transcriptional regulator [Streptomyces sp. BR123]|uniref:helix-turn-helix transcriptional regulator n=1 Tax=Streptomyces sp. BR123 TaxID=2749828 RepID=UPI001C4EF94A|nr:hypothetical protein [Streptomyces sp. BR123]
MTAPRKLARQKPPEGIVYIDDYEAEDGTVSPGIASRVGVTPSTYRKWRMVGKGPQTFPLGKRVAARIAVIDAWIAEQEQRAMAPSAA